MKILVCGASGLLGKDLCKELSSRNIDFVGTFNSNKKNDNFVKVNFFNVDEINELCIKNNITHVVNLIAERNVDVCENDWKKTYDVNVKIVENLISVCNLLRIHLLHLSTDYVFDGLNPPYDKTSKRNPLQFYGISKLIAELRVQNMCDIYTIVRTPVLYSLEIDKISESPVSIIGKQVMNLTKIAKLDNVCIRRPTNCKGLSGFIIDMLCKVNYEYKNAKNIYHYSNTTETFTKYEIGMEISKILSLKNVMADTNINKTLRPIDTQLISDNKNYFFDMKNDLETIFNKYKIPKITKNNGEDFLFLMDFDGTIVTEEIHFNIYKKILKDDYNIDFTMEEYMEVTNNASYHGKISNYFMRNGLLNENQAKELNLKKKKMILKSDEHVELIKNFDIFIKKTEDYNVKIVVVSNSPREYIEHLCEKIKILKTISFWITREDYNEPKPSGECYQQALNKYGDNKKFFIGFENSLIGLRSINNVTNTIFGCVHNSIVHNYDNIYYYDDYNQITNFLFI